MAVVKHAFDRNVVDVLVHQAKHLRLLEGAHASMWTGHEDAHTALATHGVFGCATGVATGSAKDIKLFTAAGQFVLKQITEQLHGHVFKSQGRAIGQCLDQQAFAHGAQWHDFFCTKHSLCVSLVAKRLQVIRRNVIDEQRQHLKSQSGIALGLQNRTQAS